MRAFLFAVTLCAALAFVAVLRPCPAFADVGGAGSWGGAGADKCAGKNCAVKSLAATGGIYSDAGVSAGSLTVRGDAGITGNVSTGTLVASGTVTANGGYLYAGGGVSVQNNGGSMRLHVGSGPGSVDGALSVEGRLAAAGALYADGGIEVGAEGAYVRFGPGATERAWGDGGVVTFDGAVTIAGTPVLLSGLKQASGGTGAAALTCSAGQHLTSDGSAYSCSSAAVSGTFDSSFSGYWPLGTPDGSQRIFASHRAENAGRTGHLLYTPATQGVGAGSVTVGVYDTTAAAWICQPSVTCATAPGTTTVLSCAATAYAAGTTLQFVWSSGCTVGAAPVANVELSLFNQ